MRTTSAKSINLHTIRKVIDCPSKKIVLWLLSCCCSCASVIWRAQWSTSSERVNVSVKNQRIFMKLPQSWLTYNIRRFWIVFKFLILFNRFSTRKVEKLDFWHPIIPKALNINNLRKTSTKSIKYNTLREFI